MGFVDMRRRFAGLVCSLIVAVAHPVAATPQTDADYIAASFVRADDFQKTLRDMLAKAGARQLAGALAQRSVKIRDEVRLVALLPDYLTDGMAQRLEHRFAQVLVQGMEPAQLAALADDLRRGVLDPGAAQASISATRETIGPDVSKTLEEVAKTAAGVTLISLAVLETRQITVDLTAPFVPDLLVVDGLFDFPNRIVRQDLIRELRAAGP